MNALAASVRAIGARRGDWGCRSHSNEQITKMLNTAVAQRVSKYFDEVRRYPVLTREEELALAWKWRNEGDENAARSLVTSNLRFVVKIAREYQRYGMKLEDLIQEGNVGLLHAVQKFDPEKGYRLISYAVWWIKA